MKKKIGKVFKGLGITLVTAVVVGTVWNLGCRTAEKSALENAYGEKVSVDGKDMSVSITGKEDGPVIVLLPGFGEPSPVLEFKPLAEALGRDYRVISVEPFGYGLSDGTKETRSAEKISAELHQCLQQLGVEKYYLMGHSISGLYCLYYANTYTDEVEGFIGIDPSVPRQDEFEPFDTVLLNRAIGYLTKAGNTVGLSRLLSVANHRNAIYSDGDYAYTDTEIDVFRILTLDNSYNATIMREMGMLKENLENVREMKFPESIPVLNLVSKSNCEFMAEWESLHWDVITEQQYSKVIVLEGGHYLHLECRDDVVESVREWIQ